MWARKTYTANQMQLQYIARKFCDNQCGHISKAAAELAGTEYQTDMTGVYVSFDMADSNTRDGMYMMRMNDAPLISIYL